MFKMLCAKNVKLAVWYFKLHGFIKNNQFKKAINLQSCTMSQSNVKKRGCFIVFEGCDRCGKSTQSKLLVEYLESQNVPVKHMAFPNRQSLSGILINSYLTNKQDMPDECIHLLFAINRWEIQNEMKSLLTQGTTLVVDRYSYSGVAYSAAKGLNFDWCVAPERGLIRPDLVFYLKTKIDTLTSRGNFGLERYEREEFQEKVSQIFQTIYETDREYWTEIDASQTVERIRECISAESIKLISSVGEEDIHLLWK